MRIFPSFPVHIHIVASNQIKSIFVYLTEKSTMTVIDAKVVYRILLGGQCYSNWHEKFK